VLHHVGVSMLSVDRYSVSVSFNSLNPPLVSDEDLYTVVNLYLQLSSKLDSEQFSLSLLPTFREDFIVPLCKSVTASVV
jgi:hypothetical protein